jgi:hypothetical protein
VEGEALRNHCRVGMRKPFLDAMWIKIGADYLFSKTRMAYAATVILVLLASPLLAQARPEFAWSIAFTQPAYLGGSITVIATFQNLVSVFAKVRQAQVEFDWNQTFTGPLKILQPGESYEWKFQNCTIPEHTWAGKHSFVTSFFVSRAEASGNWSSETRESVRTDFSVEPPQQAPSVSIGGFFSSLHGILFLFLTAAFVVVVAVASGATSPRRKTLHHVTFVILSIMSLVVLLYSVGIVLDSWRLATGLWALQSLSIFFTALASVLLVVSHKRLWSISFERALDTCSLSPGAIGLSCFMLNFTLCTLEFLLPFREVLVTFLPFLQPAAGLIPVSFTESAFLVTYLGASLWILSPGPAVLFGVRVLRRWNPRRGRTVLELLQIMFYASALLGVYSWWSGSTPSGESFLDYGILLLLFLLPGSLVVPLMTWLFAHLPRTIARYI